MRDGLLAWRADVRPPISAQLERPVDYRPPAPAPFQLKKATDAEVQAEAEKARAQRDTP